MPTCAHEHSHDHSARHRPTPLILLTIVMELAGLWRRGYPLGGKVIVRCHSGHLFSTLWIPAVSVKSVRLGCWRAQRCPVGKHWSIVVPVKRSELGKHELELARTRKNISIP